MLEDVLRSYRRCADVIDWQSYNKNELFFKYIEHEHDYLADNYFAGIVCRFWGYAGKIYNQCNKHVPFEDCHACIIDAIRYVLDKRVWENKTSSLYNDKNAPDKAMHIAMRRQKAIMVTKLNSAKRLSNFNCMSIDSLHEVYNDSADGMFLDEYTENKNEKVNSLIASYFDGDDYLNGLLLDAVCYNNIKTGKKPGKQYFGKVLSLVKNLDMNSYEYFKDMYFADKKIYENTLEKIKEYDDKFLRIKLKNLLHSIEKGGMYNDD